MIYKRGKTYWYNFRWTIKNADGTNESFRIVKSAKAQSRADAKEVEDEHRRALRRGEIRPNDPWPKPTASSPPVFRWFAKEFLQYSKTHTKPGTHTFYEGSLSRLLTFAAIGDAALSAITDGMRRPVSGRDAVRSQVIDVLEAQEIKETGNEKG